MPKGYTEKEITDIAKEETIIAVNARFCTLVRDLPAMSL